MIKNILKNIFSNEISQKDNTSNNNTYTPIELKEFTIPYEELEKRFTIIGELYENKALVSNGVKYGFVNPHGEVVIPLNYNAGNRFSDGVALMFVNSYLHIIDHEGNLLNKPVKLVAPRSNVRMRKNSKGEKHVMLFYSPYILGSFQDYDIKQDIKIDYEGNIYLSVYNSNKVIVQNENITNPDYKKK